MSLWSDDLERTREESRGLAPRLAEAFGAEAPPAGCDDTALLAFQRAALARLERPHPDARPTSIAGVPCRVFRPDGRALATVLHFHGGGMALGSATMHDHEHAALVERHPVAVVSVDYRLAPEHPWPSAPDDGFAVARWLVANAEREFGSPRIVVTGESAGAALALGTLLRIRDELDSIAQVHGAMLTFGIYDWSTSPAVRADRPSSAPDTLDPEMLERFADWYLPGRTLLQRRESAISPLYGDLADLPPALMTVGTADHLYRDTIELAERWTAAGNELDLLVAPDAPHGFTAIDCGATAEYRRRTQRFWQRMTS